MVGSDTKQNRKNIRKKRRESDAWSQYSSNIAIPFVVVLRTSVRDWFLSNSRWHLSTSIQVPTNSSPILWDPNSDYRRKTKSLKQGFASDFLGLTSIFEWEIKQGTHIMKLVASSWNYRLNLVLSEICCQWRVLSDSPITKSEPNSKVATTST